MKLVLIFLMSFSTLVLAQSPSQSSNMGELKQGGPYFVDMIGRVVKAAGRGSYYVNAVVVSASNEYVEKHSKKFDLRDFVAAAGLAIGAETCAVASIRLRADEGNFLPSSKVMTFRVPIITSFSCEDHRIFTAELKGSLRKGANRNVTLIGEFLNADNNYILRMANKRYKKKSLQAWVKLGIEYSNCSNGIYKVSVVPGTLIPAVSQQVSKQASTLLEFTCNDDIQPATSNPKPNVDNTGRGQQKIFANPPYKPYTTSPEAGQY